MITRGHIDQPRRLNDKLRRRTREINRWRRCEDCCGSSASTSTSWPERRPYMRRHRRSMSTCGRSPTPCRPAPEGVLHLLATRVPTVGRPSDLRADTVGNQAAGRGGPRGGCRSPQRPRRPNRGRASDRCDALRLPARGHGRLDSRGRQPRGEGREASAARQQPPSDSGRAPGGHLRRGDVHRKRSGSGRSAAPVAPGNSLSPGWGDCVAPTGPGPPANARATACP
jgi:hypothetical protein